VEGRVGNYASSNLKIDNVREGGVVKASMTEEKYYDKTD